MGWTGGEASKLIHAAVYFGSFSKNSVTFWHILNITSAHYQATILYKFKVGRRHVRLCLLATDITATTTWSRNTQSFTEFKVLLAVCKLSIPILKQINPVPHIFNIYLNIIPPSTSKSLKLLLYFR
jgi:hypothetical protein